MRTIEIDDGIYNYLQSKAIPFEETPSLTLRRLLGLKLPSTLAPTRKTPVPRQKERKTDLAELVVAGLLDEGETLRCHDYSGNPLQDATAIVTQGKLAFRGHQHSMSALARELLRQNGFSSSAVRGPSHWRTENGTTVRELWSRHLQSAGPEAIGEYPDPAPDEQANATPREVNMTWLDWIVRAFENLGGKSSYYYLYNEILRIRPKPFPASWKAIVRRTIETHSSDSDNFKEGNPDLFYSVSGIGSGEWGLRPPRA